MSDPISVYSCNPHYFCYQGSPLVLITSDQHYGAVINADFDYVAYLDKLASKGMNFTRIYPGAYIEKENEYTAGNPLGPANGRQILPWARTTTPGAHPVLGGYQYDLDQWDTSYFDRLLDFCTKAGERGIIVEICFFNGMYADRWPFQAMHAGNNLQRVGTCGWDMVQSLTGDPQLVWYQGKYVAEITTRLNDLDNVTFHICDEPWMGRVSPAIYGPWVGRMIDIFEGTEKGLPKKHLLGQTVDWRMRHNAADYSADNRIQYVDIEYSRGADDLENEYVHDKPIVYIESVFYPHQYSGDKLSASRVEAWEFMVGGCAGFMQLNALYTTSNPAASDTDIDALLDVLVTLKSFLRGLDLYAMRRDTSFIVAGVPTGAFASAISEPGKQYAFYIHHSSYQDPPSHADAAGSYRHSYVVTAGSYREAFTLDFPAGPYAAEWIDPSTGSVMRTEEFVHKGGHRTLTAPGYSIDIAFRMRTRE
jgi:hypothetical protein